MTELETRTFEIRTGKLKKEERPLRLLMLADLHNGQWGSGQSRLLEAADAFSADMILCAGDMVLGQERAGMNHTLELFEGLAKRRIPVIAANGNHESRMRQMPERYGTQYGQYAARLKALGVQIPVNETYRTCYGSMQVHIHGYEMPLAYYKKFCFRPYDGADLSEKLGVPEAGAYHILMAHNPVYFKQYAKWGADLTLAGHLHGGLIRIPGIGGLVTPQAKLFPRYDRGLFERKGKYLAVSPGLGGHTVPIRIWNPPWLVSIAIKGTG